MISRKFLARCFFLSSVFPSLSLFFFLFSLFCKRGRGALNLVYWRCISSRAYGVSDIGNALFSDCLRFSTPFPTAVAPCVKFLSPRANRDSRIYAFPGARDLSISHSSRGLAAHRDIIDLIRRRCFSRSCDYICRRFFRFFSNRPFAAVYKTVEKGERVNARAGLRHSIAVRASAPPRPTSVRIAAGN